jgi:hypothetical protein
MNQNAAEVRQRDAARPALYALTAACVSVYSWKPEILPFRTVNTCAKSLSNLRPVDFTRQR